MPLWPPVLITRLLSVIGSTMPKPNNTVAHAPCTVMAFCYYTPPPSSSPLNELSSSPCVVILIYSENLAAIWEVSRFERFMSTFNR